MIKKSGSRRSVRGLLFSFKKEDWSDLRHFVTSAEWGWLLFLILVIALTAILNVVWEPLPSDIRVGTIAERDIRSDRAYKIVDEDATQELQDKARDKVLPVYLYNAPYHSEVSEKISSAFDEVRGRFEALRVMSEEEMETLPPQQIEELRIQFAKMLGITVSVRDFEAIIASGFDP